MAQIDLPKPGDIPPELIELSQRTLEDIPYLAGEKEVVQTCVFNLKYALTAAKRGIALAEPTSDLIEMPHKAMWKGTVDATTGAYTGRGLLISTTDSGNRQAFLFSGEMSPSDRNKPHVGLFVLTKDNGQSDVLFAGEEVEGVRKGCWWLPHGITVAGRQGIEKMHDRKITQMADFASGGWWDAEKCQLGLGNWFLSKGKSNDRPVILEARA